MLYQSFQKISISDHFDNFLITLKKKKMHDAEQIKTMIKIFHKFVNLNNFYMLVCHFRQRFHENSDFFNFGIIGCWMQREIYCST